MVMLPNPERSAGMGCNLMKLPHENWKKFVQGSAPLSRKDVSSPGRRCGVASDVLEVCARPTEVQAAAARASAAKVVRVFMKLLQFAVKSSVGSGYCGPGFRIAACPPCKNPVGGVPLLSQNHPQLYMPTTELRIKPAQSPHAVALPCGRRGLATLYARLRPCDLGFDIARQMGVGTL